MSRGITPSYSYLEPSTSQEDILINGVYVKKAVVAVVKPTRWVDCYKVWGRQGECVRILLWPDHPEYPGGRNAHKRQDHLPIDPHYPHDYIKPDPFNWG